MKLDFIRQYVDTEKLSRDFAQIPNTVANSRAYLTLKAGAMDTAQKVDRFVTDHQTAIHLGCSAVAVASCPVSFLVGTGVGTGLALSGYDAQPMLSSVRQRVATTALAFLFSPVFLQMNSFQTGYNMAAGKRATLTKEGADIRLRVATGFQQAKQLIDGTRDLLQQPRSS